MAMQVNGGPLAIPASQTAGAPFDCRAMEAKTVVIDGSFTATYQIQISCDVSDSPTHWSKVGNDISAAGNFFIQQPCTWIRINCSAYTSGTPTAQIAGMTSFT